MSEMRVLHLRSGNLYGGPERQLHHHALRAKGSDCHLTIASFAESGNRPEFLDVIADDDIAVHCFQTRGSYDRRAASLVRDYLRQQRIDILCTHEYRAHIVGMIARRGTKARWIACSRGWTEEDFKIRLYHALDKMMIRFADHIVAVSDSQRARLRRLLIPARKISVVTNAIDPIRFRSVPPINLKERFGFPADACVIVTAGRFSREKGQRFLIEVARSITGRFDQTRFVLFGDGPDLETIRSKVQKWRLSDRILCPGFESDLIGALKGADMLVNPSQSEGLPNIVLEAMAVGLPVVATSVGGVPELVEHNRSGLLVPYGNSARMEAAIAELITDGQLRQKLADQAKEVVASRFSFDHQNEQLTDIYRRVLA
ncbi:MAG: glycosyltransferase family 4 protein [bacterium]